MRKLTRFVRLRGISIVRIGRIRGPEAINANFWRKRGKVELHVPRLRTLPYGSVALCTGIEMLSTMCPWKHLREVVVMLKAIHAQEDKAAARQKAAFVAEN